MSGKPNDREESTHGARAPVRFREMGTHVTPPNTGHSSVLSGRVVRIDRGWSTVLLDDAETVRVRNIGADVAVGDHVTVTGDHERIESVGERRSALTRRQSFEGARGVRQIVASNIDTVFVVHAVNAAVNKRRLERELVLAFDSGARPVVVVSKVDTVDTDTLERFVAELSSVAIDVPIVAISSVDGTGLEGIERYCTTGETVAIIGASGVGKSTLVNTLIGHEVQRTAEVRHDDQRGRHTTVAAELIALPGGGWLLDTPGLRAVTLWTSSTGIERAFRDVFDIAERCRFRDCKHIDEPDCAVNTAIAEGRLAQERLESMRRLVAEEFSVEEEQLERERQMDKRGVRRKRTGG